MIRFGQPPTMIFLLMFGKYVLKQLEQLLVGLQELQGVQMQPEHLILLRLQITRKKTDMSLVSIIIKNILVKVLFQNEIENRTFNFSITNKINKLLLFLIFSKFSFSYNPAQLKQFTLIKYLFILNMKESNQSSRAKQTTSVSSTQLLKLNCNFNGNIIAFSLISYNDGQLRVFQGSYPESSATTDLIKYYGSWENIYMKCFVDRQHYKIITQGSSKAIQIAYKVQQEEKRTQKSYMFPLFPVSLSVEKQNQYLKQVISKKQEEKINLVKKYFEIKLRLQEKDRKISDLKNQLADIEQICNLASIPIFLKTKDLLSIKHCKDPNIIIFQPPSSSTPNCHLLLKNPISETEPFTLQIHYDPIMRNENHSMGIVWKEQQSNIEKSDNKIVFQFKGQICFGLTNRVKCDEIGILGAVDIQMRVDVKAGEVQFRRGSDVFASVQLKGLRDKQLRAFLKIGQVNMKYHITVS